MRRGHVALVIAESMGTFCLATNLARQAPRFKPRANGGPYLGYGCALIELDRLGVSVDEVAALGILPRDCDARWMRLAIRQTRLLIERDFSVGKLAAMVTERVDGLGL